MRRRVTARLAMTAVVAVLLAACARSPQEQPASADSTAAAAFYTCTMHPSVRQSEPGRCPLCGMDLIRVEPTARGDTAGVDLTFAVSTAKQQLVGVTFARVERRPVTRSIRAYGKIDYDETRLVAVNLRVSGWIEKLHVDFTGQAVRKGDPLLAIYSPDLVSAQSEYLLARKAALRQLGQAADSELVRTARERLVLWQFTDEQIRELEARGEPQTRVTLVSPASGYVVEKTAVEGMRVEPGTTLYRIADLSTVWVQAEVYEFELPLVRVGQKAVIVVPAQGDRTLFGEVTVIDPVLNPQTRTARVRIELPNREGALKPDMYAVVTMKVDLGERLVVPGNAVLSTGERQMVFVDRGRGIFEVRFVHTGVRADEFDEITHGLAEGERVVASANFLIDAESRVQGVLQRLESGAPAPAHRH
jgi:RND family efflux transporter MFP subunit